MWSGAIELAAGAVFVAHASMVPAGGGVIAALVAPGREPLTAPPSTERVTRLRALASAGRLAEPDLGAHAPAVHPAVDPAVHAAGPAHLPDAGPAALSAETWVQLAAVCTIASAVVHACAGPHHATEHLTFGVFFYVVAFVQFAWATQVLISPPSRVQLRQALWLNVALIVLWAVTRTVGLPGLLPGPEEMGAWDLSSKVWELGAALCCGALLLGVPRQPPDVVRREPVLSTPVLALAVASTLALVALAMTGQPQ